MKDQIKNIYFISIEKRNDKLSLMISLKKCKWMKFKKGMKNSQICEHLRSINNE